jgi:thiamine-monophosphate kinase
LLKLAKKHGVQLAGGDTAQSPGGVLADIIVVGTAEKGTVLLRSGARPGDQIYVTGALGESAAILRALQQGQIKQGDVFPQPRIAVGQWLSGGGIASAAIDISDGLSTDLSHICEESGAGAVIEADLVPIHPAARRRGKLSFDLALHGGEDYELLFTAAAKFQLPRKIAAVAVTRIGEIVRGKTMSIIECGKRRILKPHGWEHFKD